MKYISKVKYYLTTNKQQLVSYWSLAQCTLGTSRILNISLKKHTNKDHILIPQVNGLSEYEVFSSDNETQTESKE